MDGWMDGRMDGWTDGVGGWMFTCTVSEKPLNDPLVNRFMKLTDVSMI